MGLMDIDAVHLYERTASITGKAQALGTGDHAPGARFRAYLVRFGARVGLLEELDCFLAARDAQLLQDLGHVSTNRHRRDRQAVGDLRSGEPVVQELEYLPLALGQLDAALAHQRQAPSLPARAELLDQTRDQAAWQRCLPLEHAAQSE